MTIKRRTLNAIKRGKAATLIIDYPLEDGYLLNQDATTLADTLDQVLRQVPDIPIQEIKAQFSYIGARGLSRLAQAVANIKNVTLQLDEIKGPSATDALIQSMEVLDNSGCNINLGISDYNMDVRKLATGLADFENLRAVALYRYPDQYRSPDDKKNIDDFVLLVKALHKPGRKVTVVGRLLDEKEKEALSQLKSEHPAIMMDMFRYDSNTIGWLLDLAQNLPKEHQYDSQRDELYRQAINVHFRSYLKSITGTTVERFCADNGFTSTFAELITGSILPEGAKLGAFASFADVALNRATHKLIKQGGRKPYPHNPCALERKRTMPPPFISREEAISTVIEVCRRFDPDMVRIVKEAIEEKRISFHPSGRLAHTGIIGNSGSMPPDIRNMLSRDPERMKGKFYVSAPLLTEDQQYLSLDDLITLMHEIGHLVANQRAVEAGNEKLGASPLHEAFARLSECLLHDYLEETSSLDPFKRLAIEREWHKYTDSFIFQAREVALQDALENRFKESGGELSLADLTEVTQKITPEYIHLWQDEHLLTGAPFNLLYYVFGRPLGDEIFRQWKEAGTPEEKAEIANRLKEIQSAGGGKSFIEAVKAFGKDEHSFIDWIRNSVTLNERQKMKVARQRGLVAAVEAYRASNGQFPTNEKLKVMEAAIDAASAIEEFRRINYKTPAQDEVLHLAEIVKAIPGNDIGAPIPGNILGSADSGKGRG